MSIEKVEKYLAQYLGVKNFIWPEGALNEDIIDAHIDGRAGFYDDKTILSISKDDFLDMYESIPKSDYDIFINAKNAQGKQYEMITLPMIAKNVKVIDYKGGYLNYYVGNKIVLVPIYNDTNDQVAIDILKDLYTQKAIVPIDVTAL